jgi:hypothetical protein
LTAPPVGTAFFRAFGPVAGLELWKSDRSGATAVPTPVSASNDLTDVAGALFFEAIDAGGQELWMQEEGEEEVA